MRNSSPTSLLRQRFTILLSLCLFVAASAMAQITVKVDSTKPWQGHMNVWGPNGTTYLWGSGWGVGALTAYFITNSSSAFPLNHALILKPNTNTYNPADAYWNAPDGTSAKVLEANFYRDVGTNFGGQTVTFTGTIYSNSLPAVTAGALSGYEVLAVIKEFSPPNYGWIGMNSVPITGPGTFTVTRTIAAGRLCQYGFLVKGPNTAPGSENFLKSVGIQVEDADPAVTTQPVGATITSTTTANLSVAAVGSAALTYQWKKDGVAISNGTKYSGVTTPNLTINNAQVADSGAYTVTVVNSSTMASVDSNPAQLNVLDIVITTAPVNQRVEQGSTVTFNVVATSASPLSFQWKYSATGATTNNLVNGPTVSGATTSTLTLSDVQPANSGFYIVSISTGAGSGSAVASLAVKTYAEFSNMLENPGFEADPTGASSSPWVRFESTDPSWGELQTTSDTYALYGGNVSVHEGTYVNYTVFHAPYTGIYQDVPASPGQVFTGDMWFYNANGDPIPGPEFGATNECYLEVQFRDGVSAEPIQQYVSQIMNSNTVRNTWINLGATNAGTYGYNPPTSNAKYLVAPPGTTSVRFQVTLHDVAGSVGNGSLYYDTASLMLKLPVSVSISVSEGNYVLSWKSQGSTSYQVQYRNSLTDPWQNLGSPVPGTGLVITKTDPIGNGQRYYRVQTL